MVEASNVLKSKVFTRTGPMIVTLICGLIVIGEYFLKSPQITASSKWLNDSAVTITTLAVFVGTISWARRNYRNFRTSKSPLNKGFTVMMFFLTIATFYVAFVYGTSSLLYAKWQEFFVTNVTLAFEMISMFWYAAYMGLRLKTFEGTLLLIPAFLVIAASSVWGSWISPVVGDIGNFLLNILVTGVFRGLTIGAAVGAMITGIRTLMGRETGYMR